MTLSRIGRSRGISRCSDSLKHYPIAMPCMFPDCQNPCEIHPHARGRSDYFCSNYCHDRYGNWRRRLLAEQRLLVEALCDPRVRGNTWVEIRHQLSYLEWILARYPDITHPAKNRIDPLRSRSDIGGKGAGALST